MILRVATASGADSSASSGGNGTTAIPVTGQSGSIQRLPFRLEGLLGSNSPVLEADGSRYEEYVFSGGAGQRVDISLNSPDFDPLLVLVGPDGEVVGYNDDFNGT